MQACLGTVRPRKVSGRNLAYTPTNVQSTKGFQSIQHTCSNRGGLVRLVLRPQKCSVLWKCDHPREVENHRMPTMLPMVRGPRANCCSSHTRDTLFSAPFECLRRSWCHGLADKLGKVVARLRHLRVVRCDARGSRERHIRATIGRGLEAADVRSPRLCARHPTQ